MSCGDKTIFCFKWKLSLSTKNCLVTDDVLDNFNVSKSKFKLIVKLFRYLSILYNIRICIFLICY